LANPDFRLIFTRNPDMWISSAFFVQVRISPYVLFSNYCDTGDVGLLMKIEMQ